MIRTTLCTLVALLCAALLAACGEAQDPVDGAAASTLAETFAATSQIENARLGASFRLEPDGPLALGGPIVVRASGPLAAPSAAGRLPRFDLSIAGSLGMLPLRAAVLSTGRRAYLRIGGASYRVDDKLVDAVRDALGGGTNFAMLGLHPERWVANPRAHGTATVDGVATERIVGEIDMQALLADVARLLTNAGADGLLTPRIRERIAAAVKSSRVEVWTGAEDRILRQLAIAVDFALEDKDAGRAMGLEGGKIDLRLRLDDVNETSVDVRAPKGARPLSDLAGSLMGGLGGRGGGSQGGGVGSEAGEAFLKCLESADGGAAALSRCASKLSG